MKKHLLHPLLVFYLLCLALGLAAQEDEPAVEIKATRSGNTYTISIDPEDLPELPSDKRTSNDPYYSYYWEFGDFSFHHTTSPEVTHVYPSRLIGEEVEIKLFLKAHYALSPKIVRQALTSRLKVEAGADDLPFEDVPAGSVWMASSDYAPALDSPGEEEDGKTTHQVQEREDFVMIVSLKPLPNRTMQGATLELRMPRYSNFFSFKGMDYDEALISPQDELEPGRRLPARLSFTLNDFGDINGTNLFIYLTPDSGGKSAALGKTIEVNANLEGEGGDLGEARLDLEVVESRDPNRLLVADTYLENWKGFFTNGLTYRVDFQNYGSGPVENGISVRVALPKGSDPESLELLGYHSAACSSIRPGLPPCDTIIDRSGENREVIINLDNAGLTSRDADERESKGFITYRVKPRKGIGKCDWKSQAWVQFTSARREAKTNRVSTSFKSSFSLGLKTMYNYFPDGSGIDYYSAGLVLGNDKHCGWDPRLSVMFGVESLDSLFQQIDNYYIDIALAPFRIDLIRAANGKWNFLGVGLGAQFSMAFRSQPRDGEQDRSQIWTGFGDLTLFSLRKGPRAGLQYHVPFAVQNFPNDPSVPVDFEKTHWQFYFTWAF